MSPDSFIYFLSLLFWPKGDKGFQVLLVVASFPDCCLFLLILTTKPLSSPFHKLISYSELTISGFPSGSVGKNPLASAGDAGSIPELGRYPGKGHGNPFQYSCLGNPMDRGA